MTARGWLILLVCTPALAGCLTDSRQYPTISQKEAQRTAGLCSLEKTREYARQSIDPADLVAKAAYHACYNQWENYLQTICRDSRNCDTAFETQLRATLERSFINSMTPEVFEARAKAQPR